MSNPNDPRTRILLRRIEKLSLKHHRLSLLFYELFRSLENQAQHGTSYKDLAKQVKELDFNSIIGLSFDFTIPRKKKEDKK